MQAVVLVVIVLGLGHILARYAGAARLAGALKPLPIASLALVTALLETTVGSSYRGLVVVALLWSMLGDIWLIFPRHFVPGLVSFFVAHLFYIAAFAPAGGWDAPAWLRLGPFALAGGLMFAYLRPRLGRLRWAVAAYLIVLVVMGWRAAARVGAPEVPHPSGLLALVGACFFMASDSVLAVDRFARSFAGAAAAVMVTYYTAQTLLALSVVR